MAGMRGLGRVYDIVTGYSGLDICMKDASAIDFINTNGTSTAAILTVVAKPSFGGSPTNWTTANGFGQSVVSYTKLTAQTSAWVKQSVSGWGASNNVWTVPITTTGALSVLTVFTSQFADTFDYINVTVSGTGCTGVAALLYDPVVQRTPTNMRILVA